jgi:hypothetical protein
MKTLAIIGGIAPGRLNLGRDGTAAAPARPRRERGPFLDTTKIHTEHAVAQMLTAGADEQSDEADSESG